MISRLMQNQNILKIFGGTFVVRILGVLATFICSVLMVRLLGVEAFGIYSYVIAIVTIIALPVQAGMPTLVLRETAKGKALNDWGKVKGLWIWSGIVVIVLAFTIFMIFFVLKDLFSFSFFNSAPNSLFILALLMSLLVAIGNVRGAALRGLGYIVSGQISEEFIKPTLLMLLLLFSFIFGLNIDPIKAISLNLFSAAVAFFIGSWLLYILQPKEISAAKKIISSKVWFFSIVPLAMMTGVQSLSGQIDILMLGFLATTTDVGIYKVVVSCATLAIFGLQVINIIISSKIAHFFAKNKINEIQKIAAYGSLFSFILTLPVVIVFLLFGKIGLEFFFGQDFIFGHKALFIIGIGQAINAFFGSSISILTMSGNERCVLIGMFISVISNIVLNLILVPKFGIDGAAISTSISIAIWNIYLWFAIYQKLGIDSTFIWILRKK